MHQELALKVVVGLMRTSGQLTQFLKNDVSSYGLNSTEFGVLELLWSKGEYPVQQIAKKILISSSSTTYVINQLEKKGLVQRRIDTKDRRVAYIGLSPSGFDLMREIFPVHVAKLDKVFGNLSEEELQGLSTLLKKINFDLP